MGIVLLAVCNLLIVLLPLSPPDVPPSIAASPPVPLDGGTPDQRSRIDDYTARVASESFDECLANLNQHEDLLVRVGSRSNEPAPEVQFAICLANRRLAKLFEQLQKMPPAERDRRCREIFRDKFAIHRDEIDVVMTMWEEGTPPRKRHPLPENRNALCAAVFLSAHFCPVEETLRQLDAWKTFGKAFEERAAANPEIPRGYINSLRDQYVFPEPSFEANIYGMILQDRCGVTLTSERVRGGFDLKDGILCRWNAHTNPLDFTHQSGGVPVDTAGNLLEFKYIYTFGPIGLLRPQYKTDVVAKLREQLLACTGTDYKSGPADENITP
ncbi:hypothetical protein [Maioricimonas sp. JC845]|uniref:hypothetical protein n=1 Tax=Maioricimonas sp. JC845 TaxID=3232138 RepID=UPI0034599009